MQDVAGSLFASSIFPYAAFLYFLTKSKQSPPLTLFGFYFLLVFVFATIPAGIYGELPNPLHALVLASLKQHVLQATEVAYDRMRVPQPRHIMAPS